MDMLLCYGMVWYGICLNNYADKMIFSDISDKQIVNKLNSSGVVLCGPYSWGDVHYKLVNKTRAAAYSYFKVRIVSNRLNWLAGFQRCKVLE